MDPRPGTPHWEADGETFELKPSEAYDADAYSTDFEDVRRRVPDLTRVRSVIDYAPKYDLDQIIQELIDEKRSRG